MKRLALLAVVALACAVPASSVDAAPQAGRFVVKYAKPRNADERAILELVKAAALPEVFAELSKVLILPRNITILVKGGEDGPYYDPSIRTIVMNHPFSEFVLEAFQAEYPKASPERIGELFAQLFFFVLFHEVGHALIHAWDLPVVGREEDAVDAFSTIFMTDIVEDGDFALAGADFFAYLGEEGVLSDLDFADEHGLNRQRAFNIVCWVYGSGKKYRYLGSVLPDSREVRCPGEYRSLKKAWFKFLEPHLR